MITIYTHKTIRTYFYFRVEGLLDPHDVDELDKHFENLENIEHNSITTFVEVCSDTQLINFEFVQRMKPLVPKYKVYIKQRVIFGLSGITKILFRNYTSLIGLKESYLILKDKKECENSFKINFSEDFIIASKNKVTS